jgi:acyl-CoA thioesterase FadM
VGEWIETCRGAVAHWECDVTEHFTIACYAARIDQASATLADRLGLENWGRVGVFPRRLTWRFTRELRAAASFHVEAAALSVDPRLRLGHRFIDSAKGEVVTWIEEAWEGASLSEAERAAAAASLAAWDGPETEERPEPSSMKGAVPTARGRVQPADLDEYGRFSLAAFVHRFTDAIMQVLSAIGLDGDYLKTARRGYSTFELALRITAAPAAGELYRVETGVTHLGTSSLRLLHRMTDPKSGAELARLGQFGVLLDLDARRPAPLPEHARAAAARLLLAP